MERFNPNEDIEETPLRIAKDIIYSDTTLEEKVKLIELALIKAEKMPRADIINNFITKPPELPEDRILHEDGKGLMPPKNHR